MSDTAGGWGMVADLLAANADRFPDVDLTEVIVLCRSEVDRLNREATEKAFIEELAMKIGGECNDDVIWNGMTEYEHETYRRAARAVVDVIAAKRRIAQLVAWGVTAYPVPAPVEE